MKNQELIKFSKALDDKINELRKEDDTRRVRVYRITAPDPKGDIEIVLQRMPHAPDRVITLRRPSWTWSPVTYWTEDMI